MSAIPKLKVQLINDDGPESPLLEPFVTGLAALPWIEELRVVIPALDKSWIGCALSRKGKVGISNKKIGPCDAILVEGTPADCANLGIYNFYSEKPDLVLSGPNLGQNAGGPFTLASGTLGGALVASLSGISAMAVSSELTPGIWDKFLGKTADFGTLNAPLEWQRIASTSISLVEKSLKAGLHTMGAVVNINLPWGADLDSEVVITKIQGGYLPSFFTSGGDGTYHHSFNFPDFDPVCEGSFDHDCIVQKKISISMIKPMHAMLELSKEKELELLEKLK